METGQISVDDVGIVAPAAQIFVIGARRIAVVLHPDLEDIVEPLHFQDIGFGQDTRTCDDVDESSAVGPIVQDVVRDQQCSDLCFALARRYLGHSPPHFSVIRPSRRRDKNQNSQHLGIS